MSARFFLKKKKKKKKEGKEEEEEDNEERETEKKNEAISSPDKITREARKLDFTRAIFLAAKIIPGV